MKTTRTVRALELALVAAACALVLPASAQGLRPSAYFVQGGATGGGTWNAGAGLVWPWAWRTGFLGGEVGGITELSVNHWDARAQSGRRGFTQVALVPLLRLRFDAGRSPWFAEAGIGISAMDQHFATQTKRFSTTFNFVDVIGIGRSFGAAGAQELGLRLQHVSNGGIRSPNPGKNFVQLRYAAAF